MRETADQTLWCQGDTQRSQLARGQWVKVCGLVQTITELTEHASTRGDNASPPPPGSQSELVACQGRLVLTAPGFDATSPTRPATKKMCVDLALERVAPTTQSTSAHKHACFPHTCHLGFSLSLSLTHSLSPTLSLSSSSLSLPLSPSLSSSLFLSLILFLSLSFSLSLSVSLFLSFTLSLSLALSFSLSLRRLFSNCRACAPLDAWTPKSQRAHTCPEQDVKLLSWPSR